MVRRGLVLFSLCVAVAAGVTFMLSRKAMDREQARQPKTSESPSRIVMLGDSRIAQADWAQLLGRSDVANRGISGDTTAGVLGRLSESVPASCELCVIQIGVNDLYGETPLPEIERNCGAIFAQIRQSATRRVLVTSVILTSDAGSAFNARITELNARLMQLANQHRCEWLDLNGALAPDGALERRLSPDGLHLNADGYAIWAALLKPRL